MPYRGERQKPSNKEDAESSCAPRHEPRSGVRLHEPHGRRAPLAILSMRSPNSTPQPDAGLLVLRFGLAGILLFHGIYKATHGVAWIGGPLSKVGLPSWLA